MKNIYNELKKAKSKETSANDLRVLLENENEQVKQASISNESFTEMMQIAIASDTNISEDKIRLLANSNFYIVRNCIAMNKECPIDIIEEFFEKKDALMGVSSNPRTPVKIIEELLNFDRGIYKEFISSNSATPIYILEQLSASAEDDIRVNTILNSSTPNYIINSLINDKSSSVRLAITKSPNVTKEILTILLKDENIDVSQQAKDNLKKMRTSKEINDEVNEKLEKNKDLNLNDEFNIIC